VFDFSNLQRSTNAKTSQYLRRKFGHFQPISLKKCLFCAAGISCFVQHLHITDTSSLPQGAHRSCAHVHSLGGMRCIRAYAGAPKQRGTPYESLRILRLLAADCMIVGAIGLRPMRVNDDSE
jgi:hypothetical protein